jgi:hypothetical protein
VACSRSATAARSSGSPPHHGEAPELSDRADQLVRQAVAERRVVRVPARVREREHDEHGAGDRAWRRGARRPAQLLLERRDVGVRRHVELLAYQSLERPRMAQRRRPVARRVQRVHQAEGRRRAERVGLRQAAPPADRRPVVAFALRALGEVP